MKPKVGESPQKRETTEEFAARVAKEMRAEAERLETRAKRAQDKAERLKNSASIMENGK